MDGWPWCKWNNNGFELVWYIEQWLKLVLGQCYSGLGKEYGLINCEGLQCEIVWVEFEDGDM